jgi:autotransporter passenger strand-loop-strand repeat protein
MARFATVSDGGFQLVFSGGTAISASVDSGGMESVAASGTASFTTVSSGGFEVLSAGGSATSTTVDLSGSIVLLDFAYSAGGTVSVNSTTDVLSVTMGDNTYTQQLAGTYTSTAFTAFVPVSVAFAGGTQVELEGTLCFCIDTLIETPAGQVKVQDLAEGDPVMTRRGVVRPITWIGTGAVLATRGQRGSATPVIVHKGALADNVPTHDLRVTKGHSLYIDHVLIPVEFLVNHRSIEWDDRAQEVKLFHIELETHDVLIANGAPAESYRDDGNRWLFRNINHTWIEAPKQPYAPVLTGGALVDEVWQRLLDRAGPRPGLPLTEEADLHLVVDGRRLDAKSRHGETLVFRLLARPETVRVVSRSGAPQELGVARDPRELGVALWRIMLRQGPRLRMIEAEDAALAEGFHGYEAEHQFRWTDGDALLPAALYDGLHGGFELELHVACRARYGADLEARAAAA